MPPKVPSDPGGFGLDGDQGQASDPLQQNSLPGDNLGSLPPLFSSDEGVTFQSPAAALAEAGGSANSQSAPSVTGNTSAFVINVTYEASAASAPAAFKTAVASVVQYYESVITNPITVNITVGYGTINGQNLLSGALGESETFLSSFGYSTIKNALAGVDPAAAGSLPSSAPGTMWLATAEAKALGLSGASSNVDGFVGFANAANIFDYDNSNGVSAGQYDFMGVVGHEFTEVMGRLDLFGATIGSTANSYSLLDMFHYTAPGAHTFTGTTTNYFSIDGGTTNLDNFNTDPNGDPGDWAGSAGNDSYDAFSNSGVVNGVSQTDITELNALGYSITPPTGIAVTATGSEAIQGGSPVPLLTTASITDPTSTTLSSATIKIGNGSGNAVAGDQLLVNGQQSGTVGSGAITVSWNATTNTLTLTGTASIATYQTLLNQVSYQDAGTDASSGSHSQRTVTWTVNDGTQNLSATSQITIDRPPIVSNDTGFDLIGTTLTVGAPSGVLSNDSDQDNDTLTVSAVNGQAGNVGASVAGTYGHLTLNANGSYSYIANNGALAGSIDTFTYTASDGLGGTAAATLKITLDNALQTLPLAVLTPTGQATPSSWTLLGSGGNGGLTFSLASAAAHGTAVVNANGSFTYAPVAGYSGSDSFQFKVTDTLGLSSLNTVSVGVGNSGYQVTQSLQLTAAQGAYLSQTPSGAGNQKTWTWSGWVDPSSLANGGPMDLFTTSSGSGSSLQLASLRLNGNNQLEFYDYSSATNTYSTNLLTSQQFGSNSWYQVTLVYDTTQSTATNRVKLFVNGQQITSFASQIDPVQNSNGTVNSAAARYLGLEAGFARPNSLNGNLADVQFVDGQALNASALGQTINGQWQPIAYTGSYGTNGYHLTFASGAIGTDVSGNGNNWTPVNLSAANVSSLSPGGSGTQVALTLDNGLTVNNGSSHQLSGATVKITGGFAGDGDVLSVNTSGTSITASWNAANETLTLSGTDTAANYQAVLNKVMFSSSASDPTNGGVNATRTATWQVTDATNSTVSAPQTETIDISPAYAPIGGARAQNTMNSETPVVIGNGNLVELNSSATVPVVFAGPTGTLELDDSSSFSGQISGFFSQDEIDLRDINFATQPMLGYAANDGNTSGTLTVSDGGRDAKIALLGNYMASEFATSSDGHGGTLVTAQPGSSTEQTSLMTPQIHT